MFSCLIKTWIREKAKLIESTDDLGTDLGGVMQLQRRLSGLERDLAAIQAKLDSLNKEADRLQDEKPEEAAAIREKITQITELWQELKTMVMISFKIKKLKIEIQVQARVEDCQDHLSGKWRNVTT